VTLTTAPMMTARTTTARGMTRCAPRGAELRKREFEAGKAADRLLAERRRLVAELAEARAEVAALTGEAGPQW
jgi:hypothetical protein